VPVSVTLTDLVPNTTYHYRIHAGHTQVAGEATHGQDVSFTTTGASAPAPPSGGGGGGGGGGGESGGGGGGGGGAQPADLELTGSVDKALARTGESLLYRFSVRVKNNTETSGASNIVLTNQLPAGVELVSTRANRGPGCTGTTTLTCRLDFLSGTLVAVVEFAVRVTQQGDLLSSASVRGDESDPDTANNAVALRVGAPAALLPPAVGGQGVAINVVTGTNRVNVLNGTAGRDRLVGLGGNDTLFGRGGIDILLGGSGNDRLVGGPGRDDLQGGLGNDRIESRDGVREVVNCGAGRDTVLADRLDVVRNCEVVRRR
jgi:uncharacterized repeat protein (TIGR01451 family)